MYKDYDHLFKLLIVGNSGVGKSNLILRFIHNVFREGFMQTIGVDFNQRIIEVNGSKVKLQIWDPSGQQSLKTATSSYYKGTHGIIIVFDVTDRQSFKDIQAWLEQNKKYGNQNVTKLLIGNKTDLQASRKVQVEEVMALAESLGIKFVETSAKNSSNVIDAFVILANEIKSRAGIKN